MTITDAFVMYDQKILYKQKMKTRKNYRSLLTNLLRAWGDIHIELIGEEQMVVLETYMLREGHTSTTRRGYLLQFRKVIDYYRKKGMSLINLSDYEMPPNDTAPRPFLETHEIEALIAASKNPRDKAMIACLFISGCRISEMLNLNREDIDVPIDAGGLQEVTVYGKNDKYRPVFLNEAARRYLAAYLETRTDRFHPLFISGQNRRITVSRVEQIVHECTRAAGLEKRVTPHILRHTFSTDLLRNGAPLYEVSKLMGHANISTTANIYGHFDTKMRKEALSRAQTPLAFF